MLGFYPLDSQPLDGLESVAIPVVDFAADDQEGFAPLTVNFTDLSSGSPTSWAWDFDNSGSTDSTEQNPTFVFTTPGLYSVKLTATNASGPGTLTKTAFINVTEFVPPPEFDRAVVNWGVTGIVKGVLR